MDFVTDLLGAVLEARQVRHLASSPDQSRAARGGRPIHERV